MHSTLFSALLFLPACSLGFSLDNPDLYWNYTSASLAPTTSQKCKDAYSAEINCEDFLVRRVYGDDWYFSPIDEWTTDDIVHTCTTTCESSLATYIANVQAACRAPGDKALRSKSYDGDKGFENVPVDTIGRIFQYWLFETCAKNENGGWCLETVSAFLPPDFTADCTWDCAVAHYWIDHMYPYSRWEFAGPSTQVTINNDTYDKINKQFLIGPRYYPDTDEGWESIRKCGREGNITHPPFDTGLAGEKIATTTTAASTSSTPTGTGTGTSSKTSPSPAALGSNTISGTSAVPIQTGAGAVLTVIHPGVGILGVSSLIAAFL